MSGPEPEETRSPAARSRKPALSDLVGNLGRASIALVRAEARELQGEVVESAKVLARAGGYGAVAAGLALLGVGLVLAAAVVGLTTWLPLWGALCLVGGLTLLVALLMGLAGRAQTRRLESPAVTIRQRFRDHRRWWENEITGAPNASEDGE